jgi:glucose/arabinose dehydrogenase
MNSMRCALSVALLACLALVACKREDAAAAASNTPSADAPRPSEATAASPAEPAAPPDSRQVVAVGADGKSKVVPLDGKTIADTPTYKVTLAAPPKVSKGSDATVTLEIVPKPGWKLNKEFPTKLTVNEPAGVKIKKKEQTVADAVAFAEKAGRWNVQFQAESPGAKDFTGLIKFAVCTETSCDPKKEQLAWNVAVAE